MPTIGENRQLWRVGRAFRTGSGTTPRSGDPVYFGGLYPWINTGDLRDGLVDDVSRCVTDEALAAYPTLSLYPPGTLLIAMYGATIGRLGLLGIRACVNQACCALTELGPVATEYVYYWLLAHRDTVVALAAGGGQPNISQEIVRSLRIPAPERELQDEVVAEARVAMDAAASAMGVLASSARRLEELKRSMVTAAVTGEFDVSSQMDLASWIDRMRAWVGGGAPW